MTFLQALLVVLYFIPVVGLLLYAGNLYFMIALYARKARAEGEEAARLESWSARYIHEEDWPLVVTQLPVYNEANVVERAMRAIAAMDYPRDRHEIQVLDDSDDETRAIVDRLARELREQEFRIRVLRRPARIGFKAGALDFGLKQTDAAYVAIFDADFVPPRDFLRRTLGVLLLKPDVGLVQARWDHLNGGQNLLTRIQTVGLDGHFAVEQPARAWNGCFMNFNGTAGLWRREAIEDAGGWEHDTLTEDMDLSYRSQLAGWKPFYLSSLPVPAELPSDMRAFKSQQFRWAKGSIQTGMKLLPRVIRSSFSPLAKMQAFFHMTHYLTYPMLLLMIFLALPVLLFTPFRDQPVLVSLFVAIVVTGTMAPVSLYYTSQRVLQGKGWRSRAHLFPVLTLVGIGMALCTTRAVFEALARKPSAFIRTPKRGDRTLRRYAGGVTTAAVAELGVGLYGYASMVCYLLASKAIITPFLFLYASGFTLVGMLSMRDAWAERVAAGDALPRTGMSPQARP